MELIFIRHTQIQIEQGVCYGQRLDPDVADNFETEATKVSRNLRKYNFEMIFSSPLQRCTKLAEFLFGNGFVLDKRLKELDFGDWEGQKWDDFSFSEHALRWFKDWVNFPTPNGESYNDLLFRVSEFIEMVGKSSLNEVAVVTHAGVIRSAISLINDIPIRKVIDEINVPYGHVARFRI